MSEWIQLLSVGTGLNQKSKNISIGLISFCLPIIDVACNLFSFRWVVIDICESQNKNDLGLLFPSDQIFFYLNPQADRCEQSLRTLPLSCLLAYNVVTFWHCSKTSERGLFFWKSVASSYGFPP